MCKSNLIIKTEQTVHHAKIEKLTKTIFGPGRFVRAAFKLREGTSPKQNLSFVAELDGELVGSVQQTAIKIGTHNALLLGPLGTSPDHQNQGIGKLLMQRAVEAAKADADGNNPYELILLVGDLAYYKTFDFKTVPHKKILFPWPVDYQRVLACEIREGAIKRVSGIAHIA